MIEQYGFIVNKKRGHATQLLNQEILVINLALFIIHLGSLTLLKILKEYPTLSDHRLILLR